MQPLRIVDGFDESFEIRFRFFEGSILLQVDPSWTLGGAPSVAIMAKSGV